MSTKDTGGSGRRSRASRASRRAGRIRKTGSTPTSIRSWATARVPHTTQPTTVVAVSTVTTSSPGISSTPRTPTPVSPNKASATPVPSPIAAVSSSSLPSDSRNDDGTPAPQRGPPGDGPLPTHTRRAGKGGVVEAALMRSSRPIIYEDVPDSRRCSASCAPCLAAKVPPFGFARGHVRCRLVGSSCFVLATGQFVDVANGGVVPVVAGQRFA